MAKKQENVPRYGTAMRRGIQYYRTRITDADGKRVDLYAETCEELQLKEMEADGLVIRTEYPQIPPRVEYSLSDKGRSLYPIMEAMCQWGRQYKEQPPVSCREQEQSSSASE